MYSLPRLLIRSVTIVVALPFLAGCSSLIVPGTMDHTKTLQGVVYVNSATRETWLCSRDALPSTHFHCADVEMDLTPDGSAVSFTKPSAP